jgi:serine/threonine protein kinase
MLLDTAVPDPMIGRTLLHYQILDKLGEGGMGVVYKARDPRLERFVALKLLNAAQDRYADGRSRFLREARAASALSHPHIVTVYDLATEDGLDFIVMEFVDGTPLNRLIPRRGLPVRDALQYALQIADAISAAHAAGIIHRDLKPANVVVSPNGRVRVLDFGLAKLVAADEHGQAPTVASLTEAGIILGTLAYMAPEQAVGHDIDHRADMFSFGVMLYEMITGEAPFRGAHAAALLHDLHYGTPKPVSACVPGVPLELDAVVARVLAKSREARYPTMDAVIADLQTILRGEDAAYPATPVNAGMTRESRPAYEPERSGGVSAGESGLRPPRTGSERASIAVLPFACLSSDKEDGYLAAGIAAELISALSGVPDLRVASHLASFRFQGTPDLQTVGSTLNIRYVLTGSLRRAGDRIRVMAELTDATTGLQLWVKTYQRGIEDVFAVQEEIASEIVSATGGELIRAGSAAASRATPDSLDAWGLVRKAYHFWNHAFTPEGVEDALNLLRRAVELDPSYAAARAFLGLYLLQRMVNFISPDPMKDAAEALESAERAINLAPRDPEVLENAGLVYFNTGHYENAVSALTRAVEIAPFNLVAWGYLGLAHGWTGDDLMVREGQKILDRLLKTAPEHPSVPYWLYFKVPGLLRLGRTEEALDAARRSTVLQPHFFIARIAYANVLGLTGDRTGAMDEIGRVLASNPMVTPQQYVGAVMLLSRDPERARVHTAGLEAAGWISPSS